MSDLRGSPPISFSDCPKEDSKDCSPSILPRPTGYCKRCARNIPFERVNPDPKTGVRRKMILPPMHSATHTFGNEYFGHPQHHPDYRQPVQSEINSDGSPFRPRHSSIRSYLNLSNPSSFTKIKRTLKSHTGENKEELFNGVTSEVNHLKKHLSTRVLPRPTGHCKRYARNIPFDRVNPDQKTGVRRKMLLPPLSSASNEDCDIGEQVEVDFRQAAADCMVTRDGSYLDKGVVAWPAVTQEGLVPPPPSPVVVGVSNMQQGGYEDPAAKLSQLIDEEIEEMESSKMYLEKAHYDEATVPKTYRELADAYKNKYNKNENLLDAELEPEMAAKLLQSEEHGANLRHIPPAALYGRLFPDDRSIPKIMVTAASKRRRGVVIPARTGMQQDDQLIDDLDAGIVDYYEINYNTPKEPKPMPSPIKHEAEGDADQILGIVSQSNDVDDEERKPFKYIVTHEPPLHGNYAQLRGSETPPWFPGFFTINPGLPELLILEEPNDALEKAWESMNPSKVKSPHGNILLGKCVEK